MAKIRTFRVSVFWDVVVVKEVFIIFVMVVHGWHEAFSHMNSGSDLNQSGYFDRSLLSDKTAARTGRRDR
jgi:hypothetical protein